MVVFVLDLLFASAFGAVALAILGTGVRIALVSNDYRLLILTTALAIAGAVALGVAYIWALVQVSRMPKSRSRHSEWKQIVGRYPVLIGPAAYYLGEFRPSKVGPASWFVQLMGRRRALDGISFAAWHGTLATYYLVPGAFVAAILQSSTLFTMVVVLFVLFIVVSGAAFCLLSLVVLVHAAASETHTSERMTRLKAIPRVGPLWVRGFRQYYERVIRPGLIEPGGHAP